MAKPTLASIGRQALSVQPIDDLILTAPLNQWYATHDELQFKPEHVARISELLMGKHKMDRTGRFGPSGRGACPRQQMLRFLGFKELVTGSGLKHVFFSGHQAHMVLQLILLDAGLADEIEVEVHVPHLRSRGSLDAVGTHPDGWRYGVDAKTTSAPKSQVREAQAMMLKWMNSPDWEMPDYWFAQSMIKAALQVSSYMHLTDMLGWDLKKFTLLYWVKEPGGKSVPMQEVIIERYPKAMDFVEAEVEMLNNHVDHEQLPPMLPPCTMQTGKAFDDCAYRAVCPSISAWPQQERSVTITVPAGIKI